MPKFSAGYIFSPGRGWIKNGILETDEEGKVVSLKQPEGDLKEEAGLKHYNGIITPGFVNAHCHIELSHLKGKVPEYIGMDKFIHQIVTGRDYDKDTIETAMLEADREMEREGIVAVGNISNKLPGSEIMKAYPDKVCIGTDSLSSNHRLSILAELITLEKNYPEIGLEQLLTFATINGAKILRMDNTLGSFEKGKKPGVNLIEGVDFEGMRFGGEAEVRRLL